MKGPDDVQIEHAHDQSALEYGKYHTLSQPLFLAEDADGPNGARAPRLMRRENRE